MFTVLCEYEHVLAQMLYEPRFVLLRILNLVRGGCGRKGTVKTSGYEKGLCVIYDSGVSIGDIH
jgi:hypothetical protein